MIIESPAIEWFRIVVKRLGELRDDVVFLGGATVGLLITDPAAAAVRPTKDVDVIVEVGSWGEYAPLQERLRERGFAVVDGRSEIVAEVDASEADLRDYLRRVMGELLDDAVFREALSDHLPGDAASQQRLPLLVERLEKIAGRGNAKSLDVTKALLSAGEHLPPSLREEILALQRRAVPPLVELVKKDDLLDTSAPGGGWAPIHAVSLLAELGAQEAIEPMLRLLSLTSFDEIIHDRSILALGSMGGPVLEPALEAYADNPDADFRYSLRGVLSKLGVKDERVLRVLVDQLDEDSNAAAMHLAMYGDPAAIPYLSEVLDEEPVTESLVENQTIIELAEAISHLGGGLTEDQWRKQTEAVMIAKRCVRARARTGQAKKKLGRNDPCWCGSGRKYKKCHLRSDEGAA